MATDDEVIAAWYDPAERNLGRHSQNCPSMLFQSNAHSTRNSGGQDRGAQRLTMAAALQSLFPKLGLSKKALLLGAGFVTKPTVQILSDAGVDVTVGMPDCRRGT